MSAVRQSLTSKNYSPEYRGWRLNSQQRSYAAATPRPIRNTASMIEKV